MNAPRPAACPPKHPSSRPSRQGHRLIALLLAGTLSGPALGAGDRYRVELIVFRNLEVPAAPVEVDAVRRFRNAVELGESIAPAAPVALDKRDGAFANLWTRLERLAEYEPLVRLTFEQTLFDYHPPVRVHDDTLMGQELHVPGDVAYVDLTRTGSGRGWFDGYVSSLYRLDGTIQLRRSRFLHVDLDLEYRLDGPAWNRSFAANVPMALPEGFEWLGDPPPAPPAAAVSGEAGSNLEEDAAINGQEPEPFRLHRLNQSRQVKTDTMQYFDSAFLGAIVRISTIADGPQTTMTREQQ